jgi:hypothetical protein
LPYRLLPVAAELRNRGHDVAFCNPAAAPSKLIARAGFENLPIGPRITPRVIPERSWPIIDVDHMFSMIGYSDPEFTASDVENWKTVIRGLARRRRARLVRSRSLHRGAHSQHSTGTDPPRRLPSRQPVHLVHVYRVHTAKPQVSASRTATPVDVAGDAISRTTKAQVCDLDLQMVAGVGFEPTTFGL